ncbi:acetylglutamate kinase [Alkalicoccus daliensis]|uniref:Acetylglutamate kinase n=1 Tax=Alkalicoccus daliensis TaxID=745820 RepID=A0A1H0AJZ7_9BACI|nr:acetylglutamate kinase [Alkalicoccus daliensis]SDN33888.1 N-acetylglutamate kinase [Alkalicoccus daliensis]
MNFLVLKLGGSIAEQLPDSFYTDLVKLQANFSIYPIIVHGGGPEINEALEKNQIPVSFNQGLRVSSKEVVRTAETVLSGKVNKAIVKKIIGAGGNAFGFSGVDGKCFTAELSPESEEIGYVGNIADVNSGLIKLIAQSGSIPVISPISLDKQGTTLNVNADEAAGACAAALHADIIFVSDIPGVMNTKSRESYIYETLTEKDIDSLIASDIITGGMIPKVKSAAASLGDTGNEAVILNGYEENILISYASKEFSGTRIMKEEVLNVHP